MATGWASWLSASVSNPLSLPSTFNEVSLRGTSDCPTVRLERDAILSW